MTDKKQYDVTALGELLIDFTENGISDQGNPLLEANPGGAPCNVLAMLQKLGKKTSFIGKVGNDAFGQMLKKTIETVGIDSCGLVMDASVHTTLAFVHTEPNGERSFSFYRNPGADMMLTQQEIAKEQIASSRIFHFGSLSLTHRISEEATRYAVQCAKDADVTISFDPNLREPLWESLDLAKEKICWGLKQCDILKISDNEITFLTGESDYKKGVQILKERYRIPLIFATLGANGSFAYYKDRIIQADPFLSEHTIETTGAGDTFMGSVLGTLLGRELAELTDTELQEMLRFANAAASLVTTRRGALRVMPEEMEIRELLRSSDSRRE